jgi:hypothetical protein
MLWWLTFRTSRGIEVMIIEAGSAFAARLKSSFAGQKGEFMKSYPLDERMAKKIPKNCIGRTLTAKEAEKLLEKFG